MAALDLAETIVAIGSGMSPSLRGIVRLSGPRTGELLGRLIDPADDDAQRWLAAAGVASSRSCRVVVDDCGRRVAARVYYWPSSRSYTGEPTAEIHTLGSLPLLEILVSRALAGGGRLAERGEFTLRSFLAGKIDLLQAEAVLGVIQAEHVDDLELALEQLGGNLSQPVRQLRDQLLQLTAHLEAGLDFVEEDIEFISPHELLSGIQSIRQSLLKIHDQLRRRGTGGRDLEVVLIGRPNAGKSSLFNALIDESRVIVSDTAGTTRDAITAIVEWEGIRFQLTDTAGIEELQDDSPRGRAQLMLSERVRRADLLLMCIDTSQISDGAEGEREERNNDEVRQFESNGKPLLRVATKLDLAEGQPAAVEGLQFDAHVSPHLDHTIIQLRQQITRRLKELHANSMAEALQQTSARCSLGIDHACQSLDRAEELVEMTASEELIASELRYAIDELSGMIGEVHSDTILGEIFSRFCIGK
jgi:tRNA modification GTPase